MREHAEDMLMPVGIDLTFDFSNAEAKQPLQPEERRDIYLIFKEAINNIARHAQHATFTEVIFVRDGKQLLLRITNDGVLQDPDTQPAGQGLGNMKMRAKKLNASITMSFNDKKFTIQLEKK
jgi:signal transduction histidine kinase